jgi:sucrose-6-phosphate hydrolase SacC (GH32 family)
VFALPEAWVWDFWIADDGETYHLFFLYASKAVKDPDERHFRASIGHATSTNLTHWTRVPDALVRGNAPAFDETATWTGCTLQHPDGTWFLFYTGVTPSGAGNVQTIGFATSADLIHWDKHPGNPVLRADPAWYEKYDKHSAWHEEVFRDPWVLPDPDGNGWHMLITARANHGPADDRGVIGHATSADLRTWTLQPPLTEPGQGFGHLEVTQVATLDGHHLLLFSCLAAQLAGWKRNSHSVGGVWVARADTPLGRYHLADAQPVTDHSLYVGRLARSRSEEWAFLAFRNEPQAGAFIGEITDPEPVHWNGSQLLRGPHPQTAIPTA